MKELITRTTNKIKDKKGPVLENVKVQLIFWGNWNDPSIDPSKEKIETSVQHIIDSDYFTKLSQYRGIQKPVYLGSVISNTSTLPQRYKDKDVENMVKDSIDNGSVPDFRTFTNGQILYFVISTPGHIDIEDNENEDCDAFHDNFEYKGNDNCLYAVYHGFLDEDRTLEDVTRAVPHEIAEACTNPISDDDEAFVGPKEDEDKDGNEIADYCEEIVGIVNGEKVEGYWSNLDGGCVIPGRSDVE